MPLPHHLEFSLTSPLRGCRETVKGQDQEASLRRRPSRGGLLTQSYLVIWKLTSKNFVAFLVSVLPLVALTHVPAHTNTLSVQHPSTSHAGTRHVSAAVPGAELHTYLSTCAFLACAYLPVSSSPIPLPIHRLRLILRSRYPINLPRLCTRSP